MSETHQPWPAGTPCWVDLMAGDLARTQAFYTAVLGWDYSESDPEFMGYCNALVGGERVAGLSPTPPGWESHPHVWTVYLATDDLAATAQAAGAAGGTVVAPPMPIGTFGSMGVWADPTGATFGAWQSNEHTGYTVANATGGVAWCDLMTGDVPAARDFYAKVFGFTYTDIGDVDEVPYALFSVPGGARPAGGLGGRPNDEAALPPAWTVCFQVDDTDAAAARVTAAGGTVLQDPWDFEFGRIVAATGPDGEAFTLLTPAGQPGTTAPGT